MIQTVLATLARWKYGKKLLEILKSGNEKLSGHRSEILFAILGLLYALEKFGVIPAGFTDANKDVIFAAMSVTLADKARKALEIANKVIPKKK